jgi:DNA repair exonuclease SbcCD ATPase subunit
MATTAERIAEKVVYKGDAISIKSLESALSIERERQNVDLDKLKALRARNDELSQTLEQEIKRLRKFSDYFSGNRLKGSFLANLKEILSYIPGIGKLLVTKRSIEDLLKQQYEISAKRVREVADFSDRLKAAEQDLFKEIERLNAKIVESAHNEELAVDTVLELKALLEGKQAEAAAVENKSSAAYRELEAEIDQLRELLSDHSTKLELYSSAEERLARLKDNTRRLQETISNLYGDIRKYVMIANEKLEDAAAQIQALGTAADASIVLLDMKASLDSMTASMNETTRFVSETQLYLRENLDRLVDDLELYDAQTSALVQKNLDRSAKIEDQYINAAIDKAQRIKAEKAADAG